MPAEEQNSRKSTGAEEWWECLPEPSRPQAGSSGVSLGVLRLSLHAVVAGGRPRAPAGLPLSGSCPRAITGRLFKRNARDFDLELLPFTSQWKSGRFSLPVKVSFGATRSGRTRSASDQKRFVLLGDHAGHGCNSIPPVLVPHGQAIQHFAAMLPFRHEAVHQGDEAVVVRGLQ